ncbi:MAG: hypothetical protein DIZ80_06770 [endosymbiont of Galathealinum brachiosum]|uniref:Uncharacterized protein n=1 Tax=endosymbiont of Galathealinum brachiosum TaxID=2200906 RepID=A0A370DFZ9_9GAMM|nr:MAG: hypothetical protein DIZ80_06770 [endosymbiont of Galathealinum brachiosum]
MVMSDISYSTKLRDLSKDYYQNHIRLDEYRSRRKLIIDKIDEEFNGRKTESSGLDSDVESHDDTSEESSVFMKTIAFFKNSDIDE